MRFLIARLFSVTTAAAAYLTEDQRPKILLILFYYRVHIVNFAIKNSLLCAFNQPQPHIKKIDFRLERNEAKNHSYLQKI